MKILVVDDELVSRMKMKMIMEGIGECTEADGGQRAVKLFFDAWEKGTPYGLVVLDVTMPEVDGTQVLQQIRELEKTKDVSQETQVKVFMVSAQSDKHTIISCIKSGCNDYITKPFTKEIIMKKLVDNGLIESNSAREADDGFTPRKTKRSMLEHIIDRFKQGEIDLPSLSKIYIKFNELVKKNAQLQELAEFLKQDPAISSKLISISNSAFYRGAMENHTLEQAITRLGIKTTKETVDAISQRSLYISSNEKYSAIIEVLWEHSLSCAHACLLVTESLNKMSAKDLFTIGILHDIGKLFLLQVVGEMEKKGNAGDAPSKEDLEEWLDTHHCRAGSTLLTKWGFPAEFIQAALYHDSPGNAKSISYELLVVHAANEIVKSMGYLSKVGKGPEPLESDIILKLGLSPQMIEKIQAQVKTRMEHLKEYLG
jgi:HD-like signal output (HDOD) protein/DNA-binding NarL/FixJ family response regulator